MGLAKSVKIITDVTLKGAAATVTSLNVMAGSAPTFLTPHVLLPHLAIV